MFLSVFSSSVATSLAAGRLSDHIDNHINQLNLAHFFLSLNSSFLIYCVFADVNIALCIKQVIIRDNKFVKVNHYYVLIFEDKQVNPFSNGEKLPKVYKNILSKKNVKYLVIFGQ